MEDVSSLPNAASEIMDKRIQNEMKNNNNKKRKMLSGNIVAKGKCRCFRKKNVSPVLNEAGKVLAHSWVEKYCGYVP